MTHIEDAVANEAEAEIAPKTPRQNKVPIGKVKDRFLAANYWWMLAAVAAYFCSMVASAWRLLSFFKSIDLRLDPRFNFRLYLLGIFYNLLLPGGIGGDGLSGLWAIGLIVVALKIFIPQIEIHIAIPLALFVVGSIAYYAAVKIFFKDFSKHFFKGHAKAILVQSFQDFHGKFAPYLLSFLLSALAAVVPITVGGAGAREYIFKALSDVFHMNVGLAVFLSISFYLISLLVALSGLYYVLRPKKLAEGLPVPQDDSPAA
eukprot:gene5030-5079_t